MKVIQLTTHLNIGGIANYILTLSGALKERGAEVVVVSSGGGLEPSFEEKGIPHKYLDIKTKSELSPKVFSAIFKLIKIIKDEKPDIVHAHTRVSQVVAFFACPLAGVPYVTTCHGYFKTRMRKIFDTWGRRVIAISEPVKNHLAHDLGVREERIALVYSGVDIKKFSPDSNAENVAALKRGLGLTAGPVIGTIGRLSSVKGQKFLVEAMKDIVKVRKDAQCVIVGDGPEENALKGLARTLGIDGSFHFYNSDPDTLKYLSVMDLFIFPSVKEGLGIALLEALASGRPCIASDVGGISDVIKNGESGVLVPVGDPASIARAVLALLEDMSSAKRLGDKGKSVVRERFSLSDMSDNVRKVYERVLK
ncbi:MAG: glycosyltransferase family 4 protein [Candidatus Omnitrophota bacterium]